MVNSPEMWIKKAEGASRALCPRNFSTQHKASCAHGHTATARTSWIEKLRNPAQRHGYLSGLIIDEAEGMGYDVENRSAADQRNRGGGGAAYL